MRENKNKSDINAEINLSIGLIVDSNIESEKIKESRKFAFKKDLI